MKLNIFNRTYKVSWFSVIVFAFFLLVSSVSLHIVCEKILENSHIMGQEVAARFASRETSKIKAQELLLRSVAQSMGDMLPLKASWTDAEIEQALRRLTDYMKSNTDVTSFDMCAVIDGRLIGSRLDEPDIDVNQLKWYKAALSNEGNVAYTNLYRFGRSNEYVLTMAIRLDHGNDVLAMNLYPEQLNSLLAENRLPRQSYYYLCDPNGNIMFAINDRNMTIEAQQPYVDHIFGELRKGGDGYIIDLEGNKRGVYYTVSDRGWISIVTIPYDYLMGDYQNLLQWFLLTLGIFFVMVVMLSLREYLLSKQMQNINEVVQVMSKSFLAVFRVNFQTGQYTMLKANMGFVLASEGNYEDLLKQIVTYVEPEAAAEFADTFSLKNIKNLVEHSICEFGGEFRQRFGNEFKWVNVRLLRDEMLGKNEAIFFFREVDAEKLRELEHMKVTERALKVARENTKSRNMFFSAMSHDMRAPLNGIIGMAELAELHKDDRALVSDYVSKIKSSGKQLLTLINDILEMARLDAGKVEHLQETFDLAAAVKEIGGIFAAQSEIEQKYFEQQVLLAKEMVSGDLQGLHQILNNILSNAFKYTKANGKISFLVRREAGEKRNRAMYTFIVKDTGCGMSEKFLEKIYNPFERDSRFGVPKVVGTGLGMTSVKSLVERLDGAIHITSEVDKGTCVVVSLPFLLIKREQAVKQAPKLADFAGCRVLVAEDNDINMEIISELLSMNGLEVIAAGNGREAGEKFAAAPEGSISMVLMDMQMPEMGGCEAARAIRRLLRADADSVPILALTGSSSSYDVEAAMKSGMNNYMVKPVQMKLLAQMMEEYIHK
ncbi:ATP-binding protein [uncultured Phascolarctobacterium sp.]|uniref:hybrid sensor histidine kinase/response regulator n=1 Tax=uncultured Phascolarctobacterium sp. TaxID=512296 RepID=UPI0025DA9B4E|nr:ATP-binding protein [uncultured Phascolarctobacterium sp.]